MARPQVKGKEKSQSQETWEVRACLLRLEAFTSTVHHYVWFPSNQPTHQEKPNLKTKWKAVGPVEDIPYGPHPVSNGAPEQSRQRATASPHTDSPSGPWGGEAQAL